MIYPINEETSRPFRLWSPQEKKTLPWRNYKFWKRAVMGALMELKWSPVGTVLEVVDVRTWRLIGQYKRVDKGFEFIKESERGIKNAE